MALATHVKHEQGIACDLSLSLTSGNTEHHISNLDNGNTSENSAIS